jgi:hypothetical protein
LYASPSFVRLTVANQQVCVPAPFVGVCPAAPSAPVFRLGVVARGRSSRTRRLREILGNTTGRSNHVGCCERFGCRV